MSREKCHSKTIVTDTFPNLVYVLHVQFVRSNRRSCWDHWKCSALPKVIPVETASSLRFNGCHVFLAEHLFSLENTSNQHYWDVLTHKI